MTELPNSEELSTGENKHLAFGHTSEPSFGKNEDRKCAHLKAAIGREVRSIRARYGISATELAAAAGISLGMLSRVENGTISPSLDTLQALSSALGVTPGALLRRFEKKCGAVFVKAGKGVNVTRRGTWSGDLLNLLGSVDSDTSGVIVEPYLITLSQPSDEFPTSRHNGVELLFVLEGEVVYRHGNRLYWMTAGDSLLFHASVPHGGHELTKTPIRYLSVISYRSDQVSAS